MYNTNTHRCRRHLSVCQAAGVQQWDVYLEIPTQTLTFFNDIYCAVIYCMRTAWFQEPGSEPPRVPACRVSFLWQAQVNTQRVDADSWICQSHSLWAQSRFCGCTPPVTNMYIHYRKETFSFFKFSARVSMTAHMFLGATLYICPILKTHLARRMSVSNPSHNKHTNIWTII